jgi:putative hemolysin
MSVMEQYIHAPRGRMRPIVAPPGTSLGQLSPDVFADLAAELGLPSLALMTPWATRAGDIAWTPITHPDTNIMLWGLTDAQLAAVTAATYGQPLPFVGIVTEGPLTDASLERLWEGTPYAPYETQAVYGQHDDKPVPTILFLHWGELLGPESAPARPRSLESAASHAQGQLVFAAQVPRQPQTDREEPVMPFESALSAQLSLSQAATTQPTAAANPASQFCEAHGGRLEIMETPEGPTGICVLPDGTSCEEWSLYHGTCGSSSLTAPAPAPAGMSPAARSLLIVGVSAAVGIGLLAWLTRSKS